MKRAIIIFGPPGSGKGTQANLVARRTNAFHLDMGRYLEELIFAPSARGPVAERRRNDFKTGRLLDTKWVTRMIMRKVTVIARAGFGVVLSGSPRTVYEAEHLMPLLKSLYGKRHVGFVILRVSPAISVHRNGARLVCPFCETPNLIGADPCPVCGHAMKKRSIDTPTVIRARLKEYRTWTNPIFAYMEKNGYRGVAINGERKPYAVADDIARAFPA
ncbi:MAG: nucleoside monophosphate kinase [Candidatus Liptonbacteria bacterium]|nr:nucleoside monophosphate kinase [Candidatus Liptonbacteria bacterium]